MGGEPEDKDKIVRSLDLLRLIVLEKVKLNSNDFGLCPFHDEKTPSFHIFLAKSNRARFHCFGCGAQGDIFNYLRLVDNLGFGASIAKLSALLGRQIIVKDKSSYSFLSPESRLTPALSAEFPEPFCERDCEKYLKLREDYNLLLAENESLRKKLGLDEFRPSNERLQ